MVQAAVLDGQFFDLFPPFDDGCVTSEVGVGWCDVANALVVAVVIVKIDEGTDLVFEVARQIVVFQQDPVLQRLMPALDLALGLRVIPFTELKIDREFVAGAPVDDEARACWSPASASVRISA